MERKTGAANLDEFGKICTDSVIKSLQTTDFGRQLVRDFLKIKYDENPGMKQEEANKAYQELVFFCFCGMVKETPDLLHEMAGHVYRELREEQD